MAILKYVLCYVYLIITDHILKKTKSGPENIEQGLANILCQFHVEANPEKYTDCGRCWQIFFNQAASLLTFPVKYSHRDRSTIKVSSNYGFHSIKKKKNVS